MQSTLIVPRQRYRGPYMRSVLRPTLIEPVRYVYPSYADYYGDVPYGEEENNPPAVVTPTDANPVPVPVPAPPASPPNAASTTGLMSLFTNMQRTTFIIIVLILLLFLCVMIK